MVDSEGNIQDSLSRGLFARTESPTKATRYVTIISDVPLPPLTSAVELPDE